MIFTTTLAHVPAPGEAFYIDADDSIVREFADDEIATLGDGRTVIHHEGDDTYEIVAPAWAVVFNSQRPELRDSLLIGANVDELVARAKALAIEVVGATYAAKHTFNIMLLKNVPEWHGKARHDARKNRVKDDVCAWEHVTGF